MITQKELNAIKRENKKRLDRILSWKNYQVKLGKKYYGSSYSVIFSGEHHPENSQQKRLKSNQK
jgi:hypothetical protein